MKKDINSEQKKQSKFFSITQSIFTIFKIFEILPPSLLLKNVQYCCIWVNFGRDMAKRKKLCFSKKSEMMGLKNVFIRFHQGNKFGRFPACGTDKLSLQVMYTPPPLTLMLFTPSLPSLIGKKILFGISFIYFPSMQEF